MEEINPLKKEFNQFQSRWVAKVLQSLCTYENVKQKNMMNPPQQHHYDQVKLFSILEQIACFGKMFRQMRNISNEEQDVFQIRTLLFQDSIKRAASNRDDK